MLNALSNPRASEDLQRVFLDSEVHSSVKIQVSTFIPVGQNRGPLLLAHRFPFSFDLFIFLYLFHFSFEKYYLIFSGMAFTFLVAVTLSQFTRFDFWYLQIGSSDLITMRLIKFRRFDYLIR